MKASIKIHVETLWTNRAELGVEAELDNPHSMTNQQVVSMMFEAARLMAGMRHLPASLVMGEALTEAQVPAIYRHRHVTLSSEKIARSLEMPLKRARDVLDVLFASFPEAAAVP